MKEQPFDIPSDFTYTAHTGCTGTADNSLEAIEVGAKYGADIVEFDLSFLPDGTAVLAHDKPIGDEVTLDQAFKKVSDYKNLKVNVDTKSVENIKIVYDLAKKHGIEKRIFYTGIEFKDVEKVKTDSPEIPYYINTDIEKPQKQTTEYLQKLINDVKESGAIGINFNKDNATKELVDAFHKNNLLVSIWTVNKEKEIYKMLRFSPDNITTRRPDKIKEILK